MYIEAKKKLEKDIVKYYNLGYKELVIIHGYNGGQVLKKMVKNDIRSKKIEKRTESYTNKGITVLHLK